MYKLKKIGKVVTSKFVGTGPSSYKKRIYLATASQRLSNPVLVNGYRDLLPRDKGLNFKVAIYLHPGPG